MRKLALLVVLATCPALSTRADSRPSAAAELRLGMSTALSGPAADLGNGMRAGVEAALAEVNRAGGIGGRVLRLVALDDGYEPSRTAPNMHELIEKHDVLAVVGNVGTPTAIAALPIALEAKTPFFGAYTGAGMLRKQPPDRYVINFRASYAEETSAMVDALLDHAGLKPNEIAFFTQRDGYGDAGFAGGLSALRRRGLPENARVGHGRYERNTRSVENGLADLLQLERAPRAVIMVGAYAPCAAFIRLARQQKFEPIFLNVSFVGTDSLAEALGSEGEGVIITQVVPHYDSDLKAVKDYRRAIRDIEPKVQASFTSLEGYLATRTLLLAMSRLEGSPTRESVVNALEGLGQFDLGLGEPLQLGPTSHQACHRVWPTVIRGGRAVPLQWTELKSLQR